MAVSIRDCFQLPSLRSGTLVAGARGLDKPVGSVSVLEWIDIHSLQNHFFLQNEIVITSFYALKDDTDAQVQAIRKLHDAGEVGLILYYIGVILPDLEPEILKLANELDFPILLMPPHELNYRYSEAIMEISELIFRDRQKGHDFEREAMERLAMVPLQFRNLPTVLRIMSDIAQQSFILTDYAFKHYLKASWPLSSDLDCQALLFAYSRGLPGTQAYTLAQSAAVQKLAGKFAFLFLVGRAGENPPERLAERAAKIVDMASKLWNLEESGDEQLSLITALLNDESLNSAPLLPRPDFQLSELREYWLISASRSELSYSDFSLKIASLYGNLRRELQERPFSFAAAIIEDYIIVLSTASLFASSGTETAEERLLPAALPETLANWLKNKDAFVVWQKLHDGPRELRRIFTQVKEAREWAHLLYPEHRLFRGSEMRAVAEVNALWDDQRAGERQALLRLLEPLSLKPAGSEAAWDGAGLGSKNKSKAQGSAIRLRNDLRETLAVFLLDAGAEPELCAELLHLHPNSVKYRLKRIQDLLGYRPERLPEAGRLYQACLLQRLQKLKKA